MLLKLDGCQAAGSFWKRVWLLKLEGKNALQNLVADGRWHSVLSVHHFKNGSSGSGGRQSFTYVCASLGHVPSFFFNLTLQCLEADFRSLPSQV